MRHSTARHARPVSAPPRRPRRIAVLGVGLAAVAAVSLAAAGPALAAKPAPSSSSSLALVDLTSTDGQAHWDDQVTFRVSTTATTFPMVSLTCTQSGAVVLSAVTGYYPSYPWPNTNVMTLASQLWTSGAASCAAQLYYFNGHKNVVLAKLDFPVVA